MTPRSLATTLAAAAVLMTTAGCSVTTSGTKSSSSDGDKPGVVALLMSDNDTARWFQTDVPNIGKAVKAAVPGTKILSYNARSSPTDQLAQARTAIGQGAKVLVVVSVDPKGAGAIVNLAHRSDVKVVAYEHQILDAPVDYFVGFDPVDVGEQEGRWVAENTEDGDGIVLINGWNATSLTHSFRKGARKHLQPLFDSGKRKLVGEYFTPQWLTTKAQAAMQSYLAKGEPISAVLAQNDQMAGGVAGALKNAGKAGQVKVTGLDSELAALQRILKGTQTMSVHPEFSAEAESTAKIAAAILKGEDPPASVIGKRTIENGTSAKVPWVVVPTTVITKDNVDQVLEEGYLTRAELCRGVPATGPCAADER